MGLSSGASGAKCELSLKKALFEKESSAMCAVAYNVPTLLIHIFDFVYQMKSKLSKTHILFGNHW